MDSNRHLLRQKIAQGWIVLQIFILSQTNLAKPKFSMTLTAMKNSKNLSKCPKKDKTVKMISKILPSKSRILDLVVSLSPICVLLASHVYPSK